MIDSREEHMLPVIDIEEIKKHAFGSRRYNVSNMYRNGFEAHDEEINATVGILVCDCRRQYDRETVVNYLTVFNEHSWKYIDFYLPGYKKINKKNINQADLHIGDKYFAFSEDDFNKAIGQLKTEGIKEIYEPLLILVEISNRSTETFSDLKKVVIRLNKAESVGVLFDVIFEIAKKEIRLEHIINKLRIRYIKGNSSNKIISIISSIIPGFIKELTSTGIEVYSLNGAIKK